MCSLAALRHAWDLPDPGIEPTPPASAGGPSTTEPPGKSLSLLSQSCAQVALKAPVRRGVSVAARALVRRLLPTPARSLLCRLSSRIRGATRDDSPRRAWSVLPREPLDPDALPDALPDDHSERWRRGRWRWQHRAGAREGDKTVGELSTSQASKPAASLSEMTGYC